MIAGVTYPLNSLAQVDENFFQILVPFSDSVLSRMPCHHKTCLYPGQYFGWWHGAQDVFLAIWWLILPL